MSFTGYTKGGADALFAAKAPLASPAFTGNPTVPTQTAGNNTTRAASTAFVTDAVASGGSSGGGGGVTYVEDSGVPGGVNDSTLIGTAITAAMATTRVLKLKPGVTYRGHGLTIPTGLTIDARGSGIKVPNAVVASNIFNGSGAWTLIGGDFDGNKASATSGGAITTSCGIYQYSAAGWAGKVRVLEGPVFHDFHEHGIHFATDLTSLTDADSAPASTAFLERPEAYNCTATAMRFSGVTDVLLESPYAHNNTSHGIRTYLCKRQVTRNAVCLTNGAHGMTSLYCVDQKVDGQFDYNGTDGLVFGGDTASTTTAAGRRFHVGRVTARHNASHGVVFDASVSGTNTPTPVHSLVDQIIAEYNTNEGVIVTSSQYLHFGRIDANNNGGHGVEFAARNVGFDFIRANNNGQKGIALEGGPNWGKYRVGHYEMEGNTPDDTLTLTSTIAAGTWLQTAAGNTEPPALLQVYMAYKTALTSRISTAVLAADPDLQVVLPVGTYAFDCYLPYDTSTAADFAIGWNLPTGATITWGGDAMGSTTSSGSGVTDNGDGTFTIVGTLAEMNRVLFTGGSGPSCGGLGVGVGTYALPKGSLVLSTAGTMIFKWAQNTSDATNTTLQAGAWIRFMKIA